MSDDDHGDGTSGPAAGENPGAGAEDLTTGPTFTLAAEAARSNGIFVHASLYERAPGADGVEDTYFRPGPVAADRYPVYAPEGLATRIGMPTCWDESFPEVPATIRCAERK